MASENMKLQILLAKRDNISNNGHLKKIKQGSQKIRKEASSQDSYFVGTHIGIIA